MFAVLVTLIWEWGYSPISSIGSLSSREKPRKTYDYVFSIASAAAIGENPRLFGFDFDNPLANLDSNMRLPPASSGRTEITANSVHPGAGNGYRR